ncbi:hypothetical protein B5807_04035 [Epicoccum nigrum]|uniref:Uncharacterized protein n=1 Tax=Epicoccum nigrum TaxID=105696 RepID=A0A1Y2M6Z7_EPING|nr:hypothetical protein B5807_04035 [Epicoccum nigrum]
MLAEEQLSEETKVSNSVVPTAPDRQTNPYLEHTQFQRCVSDMAWPTIRAYVRPHPTAQLQYLQDAVKSTMLVYQHRVSSTSRWARIRVMQEHLNHIPPSPLQPYQGFNNHHSSVIVSIFTFFYQVTTGGMPQPATLNMNHYQALS